jgi:farnesyl-diphosphate farnesyltransferase
MIALDYQLLRSVSRSFYLTLRVLPRNVRDTIGLAYLLARASDTLADTAIVALEQRCEALELMRRRMRGDCQSGIVLGELARCQGSPGERILLERIEEVMRSWEQLSFPDRDWVRDVFLTITTGQLLDMQRFSQASSTNIIALQEESELDDYTYRVAGCVGEFWTKMCCHYEFRRGTVDVPMLVEKGICFGKGLQWVNILRDLPQDLRQGRCYIPETSLHSVGLKPADLLDPGHEARFRPLYHRYLVTAQRHLETGWDYTCRLPYTSMRVRLACAWPLLIGAQTLDKLGRENVLDGDHRIKVSRQEIYQVMARSVMWYPFPGKWQRLFQKKPKS